VSTGVYTLLFLVGATALALWSHIRLGSRVPSSMRGCLIHVGASLVICRVVLPILGDVLRSTGRPELRFIDVICVALPALTYAVMSLVWLIIMMQGAMRRGTFN
jgi:hypothetical protein